jgi:hypothetical protein
VAVGAALRTPARDAGALTIGDCAPGLLVAGYPGYFHALLLVALARWHEHTGGLSSRPSLQEARQRANAGRGAEDGWVEPIPMDARWLLINPRKQQHEAELVMADTLTRDEVVTILGPVDDGIITEVIATEATLKELVEAQAWIANDEAPMNEGRPLASGRVGRLVEILADQDDDESDSAAPRPPSAG